MNYYCSVAKISTKEGGLFMLHNIYNFLLPLFDKITYYFISVVGFIKIIIINYLQILDRRHYFWLYARALVFPLTCTLVVFLIGLKLLPKEIFNSITNDILNGSPDLIIKMFVAYILFSPIFKLIYAVDHLLILNKYGREGYESYKSVQDILSDYLVPLLTLVSIFTLILRNSIMNNILLLMCTFIVNVSSLFIHVYSKQTKIHENVEKRYEVHLTKALKKIDEDSMFYSNAKVDHLNNFYYLNQSYDKRFENQK